MNRRFIAVFAALCIAAALGSVASVVYRVLAGDAAGRRAARADFEGLRSVLAYVKGPSDLADPGLRARLASRYEASPNLLLIDVYERGTGDRWRIPADSPYLPSPGASSGFPDPMYPLASTILLSSPLKGDSSGKLAVDALYTSLPQIAAFSAFRDALIGLGAFLALAALVLSLVSARKAPAAVGSGDGAMDPAEGISKAALEMAAAGAEYQYETLVSGEGPERPEFPLTEEEFDIPVMGELLPDEGPEVRGYAERSAAGDGPHEGVAPSVRPQGLYSPDSGLGWEAYLEERLDAEISRSASFEQDLSLLVLSLDGLTSSDKDYLALGSAIEKSFSFRDLAFERGDDGFSVILPNIDSSHALRMAEEFFKKLVFLAEGDYSELELLPLYMGISSRAGRLVDARRMAEEAAAALEKARYEKDTHIVAFMPDPDKYRLFLAAKGA